MREFVVSYTETLYWTVEVEAEDRLDAEKVAKEIYGDETDRMHFGGRTEGFYQTEIDGGEI